MGFWASIYKSISHFGNASGIVLGIATTAFDDRYSFQGLQKSRITGVQAGASGKIRSSRKFLKSLWMTMAFMKICGIAIAISGLEGCMDFCGCSCPIFQQFRRVTSIGSLPLKTSENPADARRTLQTQRALRSKKFNPDRKFQSRLEIFNPDRNFQSLSFHLRGPRSVQRRARSKISIHDRSLEIFNPEGRDRIFSIPGPSGENPQNPRSLVALKRCDLQNASVCDFVAFAS